MVFKFAGIFLLTCGFFFSFFFCSHFSSSFCYHEISSGPNPACPSCRSKYKANNIEFTAPTDDELAARLKSKRENMKRSKKKVDRQALSKMRVLQRNLVYVTNLPLEYAKEEILVKPEYFGQYGKIKKIVINSSRPTVAGCVSAYVTYEKTNGYDAYYAILAADGASLGGRYIKTAFGTTKYCQLFLKDQECPNKACMYLHEIGSPEDSFSKDDMAGGKHLLKELPPGAPPPQPFNGGPDFKPVLPPAGTHTRQLIMQQRALKQQKHNAQNSSANDGDNDDEHGSEGKSDHKEQEQHHGNQRHHHPRQNYQAQQDNPRHYNSSNSNSNSSGATGGTYKKKTYEKLPSYDEFEVIPIDFSWSFAKQRADYKPIGNILRTGAQVEEVVREEPFSSANKEDVAIDTELFLQQALALQRIYPKANFCFFSSRGSNPPVPLAHLGSFAKPSNHQGLNFLTSENPKH